MKTIRVTDKAYEKLTALLGELTAQQRRLQTYSDAINNLLKEAVVLPGELLVQVENFIEIHRHLGYTTREEFIRDAIRKRIRELSGEFEYIEIPREDYERLSEAIREMEVPFLNPADFIYHHIKQVLKKYEEWKKSRKT